jgi:hypothetical protein
MATAAARPDARAKHTGPRRGGEGLQVSAARHDADVCLTVVGPGAALVHLISACDWVVLTGAAVAPDEMPC